MAYDVTSSNLLQKGTKLAVVLDQDIKECVPKFISNNKHLSGIKLDYLPITSLEKYLKTNLFTSVNHKLYSFLDTYLFQKTPLADILSLYAKEKKDEDSNAKQFWGVLLNEIRSMRKDREDIVDLVVSFIMDNQTSQVEQLSDYLLEKISN